MCTKGETDRSPSIVRLRGANAKERSNNRSVLRANMHKLRKTWFQFGSSDEPPPPRCPRLQYMSGAEKPPPICNRMGVAWNSRGTCECHKWPSWTTRNRISVHTGLIRDKDGRESTLKRGDHVCYWRFGNTKQKHWWYDGVVYEAYRVTYPSGKHKVVVALN